MRAGLYWTVWVVDADADSNVSTPLLRDAYGREIRGHGGTPALALELLRESARELLPELDDLRELLGL